MRTVLPTPNAIAVNPSIDESADARRLGTRADILSAAATAAGTQDAWMWARNAHQLAYNAYADIDFRVLALYHLREADRAGKTWLTALSN